MVHVSDEQNDLATPEIVKLVDYEQHIGAENVDRIAEKAEKLSHLHVANVNSTYYGGGVAELLGSLTTLMNQVGIKTGWRVIQGSPDFFSVTKKFHNALQGGEINFSELKREIYEQVIYENAIRNHLDHDRVIIHDAQPLPMITHYDKKGPWIWRCHIDLSQPNKVVWRYLRPFIEMYDAVVLHIEDFKQKMDTPQVVFPPAIDPFSIKNKSLSYDETQERLDHYEIPTDLPLISQISRFDMWKDPQGVIEAFKIASEEIDARLVLLGSIATDDPEGEEVYQSLLEHRSDRIIILSREDTALVNALQKRSMMVLQKSIREGFGLTVTEAMWKGTPVIGGNVGGIKVQIEDGENGFLVDSVEEAAERMIQLYRNQGLRERMGQKGRETVKKRFLMTNLLESYLDLLGGFETFYKFKA